MINAHFLNKIFEYKNGNLYRKQSAGGQIAGSKIGYLRRDGYFAAKINGVNYLLHRLVFLLHHKYMPTQIDHIDGNRSNNKIENLRPATINENARNSKKPSHNTSGYKGVCWDKSRNKWFARLNFNYKSHHVGYFDKIEEAKKAVELYRNQLHGSFAKHE